MQKRTFWTLQRFTGLTLIVGCCLFLLAAGLIPRDAQGNFSINLPPRDALLVIAGQTTLAAWSTSLFISGVSPGPPASDAWHATMNACRKHGRDCTSWRLPSYCCIGLSIWSFIVSEAHNRL